MTLTPDELLTTTRSVRRRLDLDRPVPLSLEGQFEKVVEPRDAAIALEIG